jgi:hypothetical protein
VDLPRRGAAEVPDNVIEAVRPFRPEIVEFAATYRVAECSFWVALQKQRNATFAAPSDAPPGA